MIFSLGHSTLSPEEFLRAAHGVHVIVDVRSHPGSRHMPHFNKDKMAHWIPELSKGKVQYEWWPSLGGWTGRHTQDTELVERMARVDVDLHAYASGFPKARIAAQLQQQARATWTVRGFYDYAWFTALEEYQRGVDHLTRRFQTETNCALVCCESLWWKCHRGMVADTLHFRGIPCSHLPIRPPVNRAKPYWKPHADAIGNRLERYPDEVIAAWAAHVAGLTPEHASATLR